MRRLTIVLLALATVCAMNAFAADARPVAPDQVIDPNLSAPIETNAVPVVATAAATPFQVEKVAAPGVNQPIPHPGPYVDEPPSCIERTRARHRAAVVRLLGGIASFVKR